jgi:hypothetical protein
MLVGGLIALVTIGPGLYGLGYDKGYWRAYWERTEQVDRLLARGEP